MNAVPLLLVLGLVGCASGGTTGDDGDLPDDTDGTDDTEVVVETDDTDAETDDSDVAAACALGTGITAFEGFVDGVRTEVPVIRGPQGRWHVIGAVRCTGIYPGAAAVLEGDPVDTWPVVTWQLSTPEDALLGGYADLPRPMFQLGPGANLLDEILVVFTDTYPEALDRDATMALRIVDLDGVVVEAEAPLRLVAEPGWVPPDTDDTDDTDVPVVP